MKTVYAVYEAVEYGGFVENFDNLQDAINYTKWLASQNHMGYLISKEEHEGECHMIDSEDLGYIWPKSTL